MVMYTRGISIYVHTCIHTYVYVCATYVCILTCAMYYKGFKELFGMHMLCTSMISSTVCVYSMSSVCVLVYFALAHA